MKVLKSRKSLDEKKLLEGRMWFYFFTFEPIGKLVFAPKNEAGKKKILWSYQKKIRNVKDHFILLYHPNSDLELS